MMQFSPAAHPLPVSAPECTFICELSVGNTGKSDQQSVRVVWPLGLRKLDAEFRPADIVASAAPTPRPQIPPQFGSGNSAHTINGLAANTLVNFTIRCLGCTRAQLHAIEQSRVMIEPRGAISEADPRLSALQHGAMNLLRVVGLFY